MLLHVMLTLAVATSLVYKRLKFAWDVASGTCSWTVRRARSPRSLTAETGCPRRHARTPPRMTRTRSRSSGQ
jgi:hypothetical protein